MDFHVTSYQRHQHAEHNPQHAKTWQRENTVDYWRHEQMYSQLGPILKSYPQASWLTVGDGRFGTDAHFLGKFGVEVLASDINESSLREAKQSGFIREYKVENAEHLSFPDKHFDFILCKESYHHFPRPALALYEMLRVARTGIVLIEPNDQSLFEPYRSDLYSATYWMAFAIKQLLKGKMGRAKSTFPNRYEPAGNYVYTISKREIEKAALGLNLPAVAFKGLNDSYLEGVEHEEIGSDGKLFQKIKRNIKLLDKRSANRPEAFGLLIAVIFKTDPIPAVLEQLRSSRFDISILERNPYTTES